jgi:hypothetical protein
MAKSSKNYKIGDFVCVSWQDIVTFGGWQPSDTIEPVEPHKCISYGFLTLLTEKFLTLAATKGVNGRTEYNQSISIPLGCINSIKKLEV